MITWNDITLKKYYEIRNVLKSKKEIKLTDMVRILSIVQNRKIEDLEALPLRVIKEELKKLSTIFENTPKLVAIMQFQYEGDTYYIKDLADDCFNAYASFEMTLANYKADDIKQVTYGLAILARKQNEKFDTYDVDERAKRFELLPTETALGVASFFLNVEKASQKLTSLSLQIEEKAKALPNVPYKKIFSKSGDGLVMPSQRLLAFMVLMKLKINLQAKYYSICLFLKTKLDLMRKWLKLEKPKNNENCNN
jgi:hypothetical protein